MEEDRTKTGAKILNILFGDDEDAPAEGFAALTRDYLFGEIWNRPGLSLAERSMITVSVLAALGREPELRDHLGSALNLGISTEKLEEILVHVAHYAGWPAAASGVRLLREVVAARAGGRA